MRALPLIVLLVLSAGCSQPADGGPPDAVAETEAEPAPSSGALVGSVIETFDAAGYTYLRLTTTDGEVWAAVSQATVEPGAEVTIAGPMEMQDFESPTLGRTFETIYFGNLASAGPPASGDPHAGLPQFDSASGAPAAEIEIARSEAEGGLTVEEIYRDRSELAGRRVSVRGQVVKYNAGIMGTNWLHLQDGSGDAVAGTNDLTITTQDQASVGDVVLVEGSLNLDRDFGAGYRYAVIVEDATLQR